MICVPWWSIVIVAVVALWFILPPAAFWLSAVLGERRDRRRKEKP